MKISKKFNNLADLKILTKEETNYIKGGTGNKPKKKKKSTGHTVDTDEDGLGD